MSGKKGCSGRRTRFEDSLIEELVKLETSILLRWLKNPEVKNEKKVAVCAQHIARRVPNKTHEIGDNRPIVIQVVENDQGSRSDQCSLSSERYSDSSP